MAPLSPPTSPLRPSDDLDPLDLGQSDYSESLDDPIVLQWAFEEDPDISLTSSNVPLLGAGLQGDASDDTENAITSSRRIRGESPKQTFESLYKQTIRTRKTNGTDPRDEDQWQYYEAAAKAGAEAEANSNAPQLSRKQRRDRATALINQIEAVDLPPRPPPDLGSFFVNKYDLHTQPIPGDADWYGFFLPRPDRPGFNLLRDDPIYQWQSGRSRQQDESEDELEGELEVVSTQGEAGLLPTQNQPDSQRLQDETGFLPLQNASESVIPQNEAGLPLLEDKTGFQPLEDQPEFQSLEDGLETLPEEDHTGDTTETDEEIIVRARTSRRPVQRSNEDDIQPPTEASVPRLITIEDLQAFEANLIAANISIDHFTSQLDHVASDELQNDPESEYDLNAQAYKVFLERNPHLLMGCQPMVQMEPPQQTLSSLAPAQVKPAPIPGPSKLKAKRTAIPRLATFTPATSLSAVQVSSTYLPVSSLASLQPLTTPLPSLSALSTLPSPASALTPRSSNTHLEPRLLDRPSAAALAKMENTTPTTAGNGTTKGQQEAWEDDERQLLQRAAAQWWHWKDNNRLTKSSSSGAALYRYFEFVFAGAGKSRSYYQLKNFWGRCERAKFGRSEQRSKGDGTAPQLVTSARAPAKAKVQAEAAAEAAKKRKREVIVIDDDDDEEDEEPVKTRRVRASKLAKTS